MAEMAERQVKSRERVADHGEVFTAQREVNAMLDLVKQETERIDSRFLEPACGDGNGIINVVDLTLVKRGMLTEKFNSKAEELAADVNQDGKVSIADIVWFTKYLTG